jgi:hypothetical protein
MFFIEWRRLWRRNPVVNFLAVLVLSTGFCASSLTTLILQSRSPSSIPGLIPGAYATIASRSSGGETQPLPWETVKEVLPALAGERVGNSVYGPALSIAANLGGEVRQLSISSVSPGFFQQFVTLESGSDFYGTSEGEEPDAQIIVSDPLARRLFTLPQNALGQTILIHAQQYRIVGVANGSFFGLWAEADAWVSPYRYVNLEIDRSGIAPHNSNVNSPSLLWQKLPVFYLLSSSPRLSKTQLLDLLQAPIRSSVRWSTSLTVSEDLTIDPARDLRVRTWGKMVLLLSTLILVVGSLNYCGLQIAEAPQRIPEVRLKRTLGASVLRIVGDCMFGSCSLVSLSLALSSLGLLGGISYLSSGRGHLILAKVTAREIVGALAVEVIASGIVVVAASLLPALRLIKDSNAPQIGYGQTANTRTVLTLMAVVSGQILCCVLVCLLAATSITATKKMADHDQGFNPSGLTTVKLGPAQPGEPFEFVIGSPKGDPLSNLADSILRSPANLGLPERSVSVSSCAPLTEPMRTMTMKIPDRPSSKESYVNYCSVSSNFFSVLQTPFVEGRTFSSEQLTGAPAEVVINQKLANELFSDQDPLHKIVHLAQPALTFEIDAEVVGVTHDIFYSGPSRSTDPTIYIPMRGSAFTLAFPMFVTARGGVSPHSLEAFLSRQAGIFMPSVAPAGSYDLLNIARNNTAEQNFRLYLISVYAVLVTLIAYIGLYSVLLHFVNSRRKEIALKVCFGASRWSIRTSILRQALFSSVLATSLALWIWSVMLKRLSTMDWMGGSVWSWTIASTVPVTCLILSMFIAYVPAQRALQISPSETLKAS